MSLLESNVRGIYGDYLDRVVTILVVKLKLFTEPPLTHRITIEIKGRHFVITAQALQFESLK